MEQRYIKKSNFIAEWKNVRKNGVDKFVVKVAFKIFPIILILLVVKDFVVHNETLSLSNLADFIFKNFFIGFIISVILVMMQWRWNEKKYKKLDR